MKSNSLLSLLIGEVELLFDGENAHRILNICMELKISYRAPTITDDGRLRLFCSPYMSYILVRECKRRGEVCEIGCRRGLPYLLVRHKDRFGLFLGVIAALIMIITSQNYIWDIRISGNERVSYSELVGLLGEAGLAVGSKIGELDVDSTETLVMLNCKDISWISINIIGTHANVQIRESGEKANDDKPLNPSNLVATRDGQIEYLELFGGNALVRYGDVVREGDILVSGVWDSNHYGIFVTRSSGKVFASTQRSFCIEVPFEYEEKIAIKTETAEKYLIFFSKEIKVFKNAGKTGVKCDTIESVENMRYFNGDILPVGVRTVSRIIYKTEVKRYTEEQAMRIAYYRLEEAIANEIPDGQILRKSIEWEITEDKYILRCSLGCIENIARVQEFEYVFPKGN